MAASLQNVQNDIAPRGAPMRSAWAVQRSVLFALILRELKTRFGGQWLGALWTLGEPLVHVAAMLLILGYWRHRLLPGVDYVMFLVTGLVPFFMFRSLGLRLMAAVDSNMGLFAYRQVKPFDTLISRAVLETSIYSFVYVALLMGLGWYGFDVIPDRPLELMGVSAIFLVIGFGLGTALAVLTDTAPQARALVRLAFWPLYLVSCVILPVQTLPPEIRQWLLWNPVLHALELLRGYYFSGYRPLEETSLSYVVFTALVTLALGLSLYRVRRHRLVAL